MTKRYQDEIEEILKKAGDLPAPSSPDAPNEKPPQRNRRLRRLRQTGARRAWALNYKHVLLAGIALLIASIFTGGWPLFAAGAALLIAGYILYYRAPRPRPAPNNTARPTKMWRGRPITTDDDPHFTKDPWGDSRR